MTMTKTKIALAAALVLGTSSLAFAALDGDANHVPGNGVRQQLPASFLGAFASTRVPVTARRSTARIPQKDGDGNRIPGVY
jgi:hypothetical protein